MASNVEEFLIEFGFDGTKALKDIGKFFKNVEKMAQKSKPKMEIIPDARKTSRAFDSHVKQYERFLKQRQRVEDQVSRFSESRNLALLRQQDPQGAAQTEGQFRSAITKRDVKTAARLRRQTAEIAANYRKAARNANGLKTAQMGVADSTRNMIRAYASLFALLEGTQAINRVGQQFESLEASMLIASGSAEQAEKDLEFVRETARRLGIDLITAAKGFQQLACRS